MTYRFAVRGPPLASVVWLVRADVWDECGGSDERMIYMNSMESNMVNRLLMQYPTADWRVLREHPIGAWPGIVKTRWKARRSRA